MLGQLQDLLAEFERQNETITTLTAKNLALIIERDELLGQAQATEKVERAATRTVALENKVTRLVYEVERLRGVSAKQEKDLKDVNKLNPVKMKAQVVSLKQKNLDWKARCSALLKDNKEYRQEAQLLFKDIKKLSSEANDNVARLVKSRYLFRTMDGCQLLYWPTDLAVARDFGAKETIHAVVVLNSYGVGGFITVNNGELQIPNELERAFAATEPLPESVTDFLGMWLGKLEMQGYNYTVADLVMFAGRQSVEADQRLLGRHDTDFVDEIQGVINAINGKTTTVGGD